MAFMTELFLDNNMIEVAPGVSRRLHKPRKHLRNPVAHKDRWWEGDFFQPYCTMYDEEEKLFKMWARTGSDAKNAYLLGDYAGYTVYLTSTDGIHWDKPELGVVDIHGRRDHGIIFVGHETDTVNREGKKGFILPNNYQFQGKKGFIWSVLKHPCPKDAGEKYVGLAYNMKWRGAHLCTSPDGIHWTYDEDAPFWQTPNDVSAYGDDCLMHLIYDKARMKWVLYRRIIPQYSERMTAVESDRDLQWVDRYYRTYGYAESDDLRKWNNFRHILSMDVDDPADTELYQFSCHKHGQNYVAYMSVFHVSTESIDIHLATSRDGINFTRVCRGEPFIPSGAMGYYDYMAMGCSQPEPIIVDDTVYIYYAALDVIHSYMGSHPDHMGGAALVTFKRDRFVSLETSRLDPGPCRLLTKPFILEHPKLFLNASTWENGSIRVEVLTRDWQPIAGFTEAEAFDVQGDALDHPVRWKDNADVSKLLGQEVRLKFCMTRARIYAMTMDDADRKLGAIGMDDRFDYNTDADSTPQFI